MALLQKLHICNVLLLLVGTLLVKAVDPSPKPWPEQFHAQLVQNNSGTLAVVDLWYDWPNGRNFNIIQHQLGTLLYDLEWTNGTSFYYDLAAKSCKVITFAVGILRPDWLDKANYLGVQEGADGFKCNVWEKADFITYFEDVETKRPVFWRFYTGREMHVITFEEGRVLKDESWQAPSYCFGDKKKEEKGSVRGNTMLGNGQLDLLDSSLHPWGRAVSISG